MLRRIPASVLIGAGFAIGLFLAALDRILAPLQNQTRLVQILVDAIDWIAPPLSGALLAAAVLYGMRHKRLLTSERAASQVLAERLTGTERRQALWVVAAAVAHDLKNPLHNLQLLVEELGEEGDAQLRGELIQRMRENVRRAHERIQELAKAGNQPADEDESTAIEVAPALELVRERLLPNAGLGRTQIVVDCPKGLQIRLDPLALRSAVENVAANAIEALGRGGRGGTLALRGRTPGGDGAVEILVEDDGPGIPEELRPRLFIPFAASHHGSSGLGLAIARALARAGGGELTCSDTRPGHTQFRFTFHSR